MSNTQKTLYNWSSLDNSYTGETNAVANPLVPGKFLIPSRATDIKPPRLKDNETAIFNEAEDIWIVVPDYRNKAIYSTENGQSLLWAQVGALPKGYTSKARTDNTQEWDSTKKKWIPSKKLLTQNKLNMFLEEYITKKAECVEYKGCRINPRVIPEINNALIIYDELPNNYLLIDDNYTSIECTREDLLNISKIFQERDQILLLKYSTKKRNTEGA